MEYEDTFHAEDAFSTCAPPEADRFPLLLCVEILLRAGHAEDAFSTYAAEEDGFVLPLSLYSVKLCSQVMQKMQSAPALRQKLVALFLSLYCVQLCSHAGHAEDAFSTCAAPEAGGVLPHSLYWWVWELVD